MNRDPNRCGVRGGRCGNFRRLATAAALLALSVGPAAVLAQPALANPWMDPNLIVLISQRNLTQADLNPQTAGVQIVDRLGNRPIYLVKPINATGPVRIATLKASTRLAITLAGLNRRVYAPEPNGQFGAIRNSVNAIGDAEAILAKLPVGWTDRWLDRVVLHGLSTGRDITVAVLDTGVDPGHPTFLGRLRRGYDFVKDDSAAAEERLSQADAGKAYGHGTHVAGIVARVAPAARILPVRVLDPQGFGTLWTVAKGTAFALDPDGSPTSRDGARVLNMSFGVDSLNVDESGVLRALMKIATCHPDLANRVAPLAQAGFDGDRLRCNDALQRPVVAAGQGNDVAKPALHPAAYSSSLPALMAVTASDLRGYRATWASHGAAHEIVAPGQHIASAYPTGDPRGTWAIMSGTSMATPWVSGVAALLMARPPAAAPWTGAQIRTHLLKTGAAACGSIGMELAPVRALRSQVAYATACR